MLKKSPSNSAEGNIYSEIPERRRKVGYLEIPKISLSRSNSSVSSGHTSPMLERKSSRKKSNHEYEKVSVTSNSSSKKSAVERIAESAFFRRRADTAYERRGDSKGEEDEHILESLRQVVRKCTNVDPVKRPSSTDVLDWLIPPSDKS